MSRFQNYCLSGLLMGILGAAGCAQGPTAPTDQVMTAASPAAAGKPSLPLGSYEMTFLDINRQPVTILPIGIPGDSKDNLLVRVHVDDSAGQPVQDGSVLYEVCHWKGVSPTTGTRGGAAPSAKCDDGSGLARWEKEVEVRMILGTGETWAGVDVVQVPCVMGWRATYHGSRTTASFRMPPADITWQ